MPAAAPGSKALTIFMSMRISALQNVVEIGAGISTLHGGQSPKTRPGPLAVPQDVVPVLGVVARTPTGDRDDQDESCDDQVEQHLDLVRKEGAHVVEGPHDLGGTD